MATEKVAGLTTAQWEQIRAVRDEYKAASLCTDPADRPATQAAIGRLYELAGLGVPQFIWCGSPATAYLVIRLLSAWSPTSHTWFPILTRSSRDQYRGCEFHTLLGPEVRESLQRSVKKSLGRGMKLQLRTWLGDSAAGLPIERLLAHALVDLRSEPLGDLLRGPLEDSVRGALEDGVPLRHSPVLWPPPEDLRPGELCSPGISLQYHHTGQHEIEFLRYEVPRRLGLVTYGDQDSEWLDLWCELVRSCGWWWSYWEVCVVAERPAIIHAESPGGEWGQLQLHYPDGPAVSFRDGWAVHAWHGQRVPATLVEDGWDIRAILAERNAEIRRCAIEKLGWDEFERHLIPVASAPDPGNPGQVLTLCDLPEGFRHAFRGVRLLLCSNGTPEPDGTRRRFGLTVPPHHTDPVAAAAETYGWSREEYASLARRA